MVDDLGKARKEIEERNSELTKEKKKSDELLLNILPSETAEELKLTGTAKAKNYDSVSVMFADFKEFTQISENMDPEELVAELNFCFSRFDMIVQKYGIEKIKTIGDAYMCAAGLPKKSETHGNDMVLAALEIRDFMIAHKKKKDEAGEISFEIRIGINSGPVVAGIVGLNKFVYDIWGDTVNIASRMESSGEPGKVNISTSTYQLVKDKFNCAVRGKIRAKGLGEYNMYFVEGMKTVV
jgi:class 3 adenylate cyclase